MKPRTRSPVRSTVAALALAVWTLVLVGCASTQPAPVESRGTLPGASSGPDSPGRTAGGERDPAPKTSATTIPLGPESTGAMTAADPANALPAPVVSATAPAPRPANPAVVALLDQASRQSGSGDHTSAAASLERAIKIDPANPWLWHRLAATRLSQGRAGDAASLAAKSNSLASGDPELQAYNWRLIARVHRLRGEEVAATAAEERARRLSTPRT